MGKNGLAIKKIVLTLFMIIFVTGLYNQLKPLPQNLSFEDEFRGTDNIKLLKDITWYRNNTHFKDHEIFDEIIKNIKQSKKFILLDMFLYNSFMGNSKINDRKISRDLTNALINQKKLHPKMSITLITDPINTVYNGLKNPIFEKLKTNNIEVVFTNLERLRDSNPIYSSIWRTFFQIFGTSPGKAIKNPFGQGKISFRSFLKMLNFKANHRKVFICDKKDDLLSIVSSANPHDASILHHNIGLVFTGEAAFDLLQSENAVLKISGSKIKNYSNFKKSNNRETLIKIITEKKILNNIIKEVDSSNKGDNIDIVMFYFSHKKIITSLIKASKRGVKVKILLDANKDAFGRTKNGIPNRVTAHYFLKSRFKNRIDVRWANTNGEQLHTKLFFLRKTNNKNILITGSANYTRRNLDNYNLETNVMVKFGSESKLYKDSLSYVNLLWENIDNKNLSLDYKAFHEDSFFKKVLFHFMEFTGISTF